MYRMVNAALARVATRTFPTDVHPWPDLTGDSPAHVSAWSRWLRQVWGWEGFAEAVEVASPVLARSVAEMCDGRVLPARQLRRTVASVMRYLLRASGRATPFGLFAGVSATGVGQAEVRFGDAHRVTARVDAAWLATVVTRLEACDELRRRLHVVRNDLAFVRDGRLVLRDGRQPTVDAATLAEVSVRHTKPVAAVMDTAASPVRFGELADMLAAGFPGTPVATIETLLTELIARRLLISSLRPPMTATDPIGHVCDALTAIRADTLPAVSDLVDGLSEVRIDLDDQIPALESGRARRLAASQTMAAIHTVDRPVAVDLRVDCDLALPQKVIAETEDAAAALLRLTPHPAGTPTWRDYHTRFLERYGPGALVPVVEIVNPDTGLGYPAGYRDSHLTPPPADGLSERDARLFALAQSAAMGRSIEVVLDDQQLADLAAGGDAQGAVRPHAELTFQVHASTRAALDRGDFRLTVTEVSRAAGTTTGRFLYLLDTDDREQFIRGYQQLPTISDRAVSVQVSCPPIEARTENVARVPQVLPRLLRLGDHGPRSEMFGLDDLAVTADAHSLYLMSLSQQRPVEPLVFNAVEFAFRSHPLMRFLCEVALGRAAVCVPFSWGPADRLPFLPRIRYGRTVLAPARWRLAAADLPNPVTRWPEWAAALTSWRERHLTPAAVYLGGGDRRIQVDLTEPAHQYLLRAELDRTGHAMLREAPGSDAFGWIDGRPHEIVVPLAVTKQPHQPRRRHRHQVLTRQHGHLPGAGDWLYVKLYGHPDRQTTILTRHLAALWAAWDQEPQWWFLRYQDPEPHLRLRIRVRDADEFGAAATRVGTWAANLRQRGIVGRVQFDTYYPETGRFGSGAAMTAAEEVFAADSMSAISQLAVLSSGLGVHQDAVVAASMVHLATSAAGTIPAGMRWLIDHAAAPSTPALPRAVYDQALQLADPEQNWNAIRALPGGDSVWAAWQQRHTALTTYLAHRPEETRDETIADLLHLHHVRMAGTTLDREYTCLRLARAAALSWTTRHQGAS